jgi:hypothetical protein
MNDQYSKVAADAVAAALRLARSEMPRGVRCPIAVDDFG